MKKLLVLFIVLIAMVSCESRSGKLAQERENKSIIPTSTTSTVVVKPESLIKVIENNVLLSAVARVSIIEVEGRRYIVSSAGGIVEVIINK